MAALRPGEGRVMVFAAKARARTFDFQAGDVGYVPMSMSHFIENAGSTPLRFLELNPHASWTCRRRRALTPHELVRAHLNLDSQLVNSLRKIKQPLKPTASRLHATSGSLPPRSYGTGVIARRRASTARS